MKLLECVAIYLLVSFVSRVGSDESVTEANVDCNVGQLYPDEKSCDGYFICANDECTNRTVLKPDYCHNYLNFDRNNLVCSANYTCPPEQVAKPPKCLCLNSVLPDDEDPKAYYLCIPRLVESKLARVHSGCNKGYYYDDKVKGCVLDVNGIANISDCSPPNQTVQDTGVDCLDGNTLKDKPLNYSSECPYEGIFPDSLLSNGYFVCRNDSCGNLVKSYEFCRNGKNFCPKKKFCTDCDFKKLCTNLVEGEFQCPGEGNYPDPICPNIYYYICFHTFNVIFEPKRIVCSDDLVFDPESLLCVPPYRRCTRCRKNKICLHLL